MRFLNTKLTNLCYFAKRSLHTSKFSTAHFLGQTNQTQATTLKLLKENNRNFDIFFKGFLHNHIAHHLLAAYTSGTSQESLHRIYENSAKYIEPRLPSKVTITEENWTEHLHQAE